MIICMPETVAVSGLEGQDFCGRRGFEERQRYRSNDYSVPVAFGHQEVWIRGYVHEGRCQGKANRSAQPHNR